MILANHLVQEFAFLFAKSSGPKIFPCQGGAGARRRCLRTSVLTGLSALHRMYREKVLSYSAERIADMLINSVAGTQFVADRIASEWESSKEDMTIKECLDDALDIYTRTISDETSFDRERKLQAMTVEIACRIRRK